MLLACSSNPGVEVDWGKDQVLPTSNDELALERLRGVLLNLTKIDASCAPSPRERELADDDDPGDHLLVQGGRLVMLCEAADMVVENAAKAVGVLSDVDARTLWQHDVQTIIGKLDDDDTAGSERASGRRAGSGQVVRLCDDVAHPRRLWQPDRGQDRPRRSPPRPSPGPSV